jgi:hypothetical protein
MDSQAQGCRLYKWAVDIPASESLEERIFPISVFISAHLLSLSESCGVKKFVVRSDGEEAESRGVLVSHTGWRTRSIRVVANFVQIWVFNPLILVYSSSSAEDSPLPKRLMKVFYQDLPGPASVDSRDDTSTEDVLYPRHIVDYLIQVLEQSRMELPESAQTLGVWRVGTLERWSPA